MDTVLGVPVAALGIGSGWTIVAWIVIMLFRGSIVTRREVDTITKNLRDEAVALRSANATLGEQNKLLLDSAIPSVNALFTALRDAAEGSN